MRSVRVGASSRSSAVSGKVAEKTRPRTDVPTAVGTSVRGLVFSATFPLTADERLDAPTLTDLICRALIKET